MLFSCPACHHKTETESKPIMLICSRCQVQMVEATDPYTMQCEKCGIMFPESEIHEHHIIPKNIGGTDKNGRIQLCKKDHDILHQMLLKPVFKLIPAKSQEQCYKDLHSLTRWWLNLKPKKEENGV